MLITFIEKNVVQTHIRDVFKEYSIESNNLQCNRVNLSILLDTLNDTLSNFLYEIYKSLGFYDNWNLLTSEEVVFEPAEDML